jgi:hypothetical protein
MRRIRTEPERWSARGAGNALEDSLGAALRAAADATVPGPADLPPLAPEPLVVPRRLGLPALAGVLVLVAGGAVGAAQLVRAARAAREPLGTVDVPRGSTVSISGRHGRRIRLDGPITLSGDVERVVLAGEGEARVEAGERPLEIRGPSGSAIDLPAGATWSGTVAAAPAAQAAPPAHAGAAVGPPPAPSLAPPAPAPPPAPALAAAAPVVVARAAAPRPERAHHADRSPPAPLAAPPALEPGPPPSPAPASGADGAEAALVASAFRALRAGHDPAGALALLDQHAARFPLGVLAVEAGMARVEALLAEGERGRALATLEALPEGRGASPPARALLRGELRASLGGCRAALADFDAALASAVAGAGGSAEVSARARAGRAACRARLGISDETLAPLPTREGVEGAPR